MKKLPVKELIKYFIFGVLTTLISLLSFKLFDYLLGERLYLITNIISTLIAIVFAYITNKLWVFDSKSWEWRVVAKEALSFLGARLFGMGLEEFGLWLLISVLGFEKYPGFEVFGFKVNGNLIAKIITMAVGVVINYIFSKFLIFKKKGSKGIREENTD